MICDDCGKDCTVIYSTGVLKRCLTCSVELSERQRRRYWAMNPNRNQDHFATVGAGPCFLCDGPAQFGVLREISRDGNSETCPTWICWTCNNQIPRETTLYEFGSVPQSEVNECE